jgi:hypothetical protein
MDVSVTRETPPPAADLIDDPDRELSGEGLPGCACRSDRCGSADATKVDTALRAPPPPSSARMRAKTVLAARSAPCWFRAANGNRPRHAPRCALSTAGAASPVTPLERRSANLYQYPTAVALHSGAMLGSFLVKKGTSVPGQSRACLTDSMAAASGIPAEERTTGGLTAVVFRAPMRPSRLQGHRWLTLAAAWYSRSTWNRSSSS